MYKGKLKVGDKVRGTNMPTRYDTVKWVSSDNDDAHIVSESGSIWYIDRRGDKYWGSDGTSGHLTLVKSDKKAKPAKVKAEKKVTEPKVGFITVSSGESFSPFTPFAVASSVYTFSSKEELIKWLNDRSSVKGIKVYQIFSELEVRGNFELVLK